MRSKCLVCNIHFEVDQSKLNENLSQVYENIFSTFCEYFSLAIFQHQNPFNFHNEVLPFCSKCREIVVNLCLHKLQVAAVQKKIVKIVAKISTLIIDSAGKEKEKSCNSESSSDNFNDGLQEENGSFVQSTTQTRDVGECKVSRYRKSIIKNYSPFLNLQKVQVHKGKRILTTSLPLPIEEDEIVDNILVADSQINCIEQDLTCPASPLINCDMEIDHNDEYPMQKDNLVPIEVDANSTESDLTTQKDGSSSKVIDQNDMLRVSSLSLVEHLRSRNQELIENVDKLEDFIYFEQWPVRQEGLLFRCLTCGVRGSSRIDLFLHVKQVHKDQRKLFCQDCKIDINSEQDFVYHQSRVHNNVSVVGKVIPCGQSKFLYNGVWFFDEHEHGFQCNLCGKESETLDGMVNHLKNNLTKVPGYVPLPYMPYKCSKCEKTFQTKNQILIHMERDHTKIETSYVCPICSIKHKRDSNFFHHLSSNHPEVKASSEIVDCGNGNLYVDATWLFLKNERGKGFQCSFCGDREIETRASIRQHLKKHPGHVCDVCGLRLRTSHQLSRHVSINHPNFEQGRFYIPQIKNFYYQSQINGEDVGFKCSACDHVGKDHTEMGYHIRRHTKVFTRNPNKHWKTMLTIQASDGRLIYNGKWMCQPEDDNKFKCLTCGQIFKDRNRVLEHIRRAHDKSSQCVCDVCGKIFSQKSNLEDHIKTHENIKSIKCLQCDYLALTKKGLHSHRILHHDITLHPCDQCKSTFKTKGKLAKHKRSHSDEKSFKCSKCSKSFKYVESLQRHEKSSHETLKPYTCTECPMRFTQSQSVQRHIKVVHSEERQVARSKSGRGRTMEQDDSDQDHDQDSSEEEPETEVSNDEN